MKTVTRMKKTTRALEPAAGISAAGASALWNPAPASPALHMSVIGLSAVRALVIGLSAVGILVAALPERTLAQADGAPLDMALGGVTWPVAGEPATVGLLPPAEILAEVRREGFYPVSRPVPRGRVYVLFAVDQDDMDVKLTVDAASGRVLWVAGAVARVGGPGYYGRSLWRTERPPVPPAEIPSAGPSNRLPRTAGTRHASLKRFPPLPRTRPVDLAGASARDSAAPQAGVAPPVTLVPVAPLE